MIDKRIYIWQRLSALVMIPLVIGHLAVMIYAIKGGLSVAEILGRTQDSIVWLLFYGSFVLAVSVHAALGLGVISAEWLSLKPRMAAYLSLAIGLVLLAMGSHAIWAVTFATP